MPDESPDPIETIINEAAGYPHMPMLRMMGEIAHILFFLAITVEEIKDLAEQSAAEQGTLH